MEGVFNNRSAARGRLSAVIAGVAMGTLLTVLLSVLLTVLPARIWGYELEQTVNQSAVSAFPTAFDQPNRNLLQAALEMTDIKEPIIHTSSLRYGFQWRNFQLLTEANYQLEPQHEFDYLQVRGKVRVVNLDEFRTYMAFGLLGRYVRYGIEAPWRIDDRPASLFGVFTIELFPLQDWGGVLLNAYLDNRYFNAGFKVQLYPGIQLVAEGDYLHDTWREDKFSGRIGLDIAGEQSFHFQLLYSDVGKRVFTQFGYGF